MIEAFIILKFIYIIYYGVKWGNKVQLLWLTLVLFPTRNTTVGRVVTMLIFNEHVIYIKEYYFIENLCNLFLSTVLANVLSSPKVISSSRTWLFLTLSTSFVYLFCPLLCHTSQVISCLPFFTLLGLLYQHWISTRLWTPLHPHSSIIYAYYFLTLKLIFCVPLFIYLSLHSSTPPLLHHHYYYYPFLYISCVYNNNLILFTWSHSPSFLTSHHDSPLLLQWLQCLVWPQFSIPFLLFFITLLQPSIVFSFYLSS